MCVIKPENISPKSRIRLLFLDTNKSILPRSSREFHVTHRYHFFFN